MKIMFKALLTELLMFENTLTCQNMTQGDWAESVFLGMAGTDFPSFILFLESELILSRTGNLSVEHSSCKRKALDSRPGQDAHFSHRPLVQYHVRTTSESLTISFCRVYSVQEMDLNTDVVFYDAAYYVMVAWAIFICIIQLITNLFEDIHKPSSRQKKAFESCKILLSL